jgi:hypothetical protein
MPVSSDTMGPSRAHVLGAILNCSESRCCGALAHEGRVQWSTFDSIFPSREAACEQPIILTAPPGRVMTPVFSCRTWSFLRFPGSKRVGSFLYAPTHTIAHHVGREPAALRDFNPAYVIGGHSLGSKRQLVHKCPLCMYRPQILGFGICRDVPRSDVTDLRLRQRHDSFCLAY